MDDTEILQWLDDNLWNGWELEWNTIDKPGDAGYVLFSPDQILVARGGTLREVVTMAAEADAP